MTTSKSPTKQATSAKKRKQSELKALRAIGHQLSPIVLVGANGLSPSVIEETARALTDHELIKVKIPAGSGEERKACAAALAEATESIVAHHIGRMVLLYRHNPDASPKLSNISRYGV